MLVASLDDAAGLVQSAIEAHELQLTGDISERLVDEAVHMFLMEYIQEGNLNGLTLKMLLPKQSRLTKEDPGWCETRVRMRIVRRSPSPAARNYNNPFIDSNADLGNASHVVEEVGEQFD